MFILRFLPSPSSVYLTNPLVIKTPNSSGKTASLSHERQTSLLKKSVKGFVPTVNCRVQIFFNSSHFYMRTQRSWEIPISILTHPFVSFGSKAKEKMELDWLLNWTPSSLSLNEKASFVCLKTQSSKHDDMANSWWYSTVNFNTHKPDCPRLFSLTFSQWDFDLHQPMLVWL